MITVYLHQPVLDHLLYCNDEKYLNLRKKVYSNNNEYLFFYSNAHLLDLQLTNLDKQRFVLDFMDSLVDLKSLGQVFPLSYGTDTGPSPSEAFCLIGSVNNFSQMEGIDFSEFTAEEKRFLSAVAGAKSINFLPDRLLASFSEYPHFSNVCQIPLPLQLPFVSTIREALTKMALPSSDASIIYYLIYLFFYLFDIPSEEQKIEKCKHSHIDAFHSMYGSYCSCIVSDDNDFIQKSRALYRIFNLDAKVCSLDEFLKDVSTGSNQS